MDEQVLRAMARWPNVPAVYGWLRLGRRGQWFLIDRNSPGFDERIHGEGSPIGNVQINEFIARNYQARVSQQLQGMTRVFASAMLLAVFVFVGFLAFAIFSAVLQLSASFKL